MTWLSATGEEADLLQLVDKPNEVARHFRSVNFHLKSSAGLSAAAAAVCSVRNDNYEEHRRAAHGLNVLPRMLHLGKPLFFASYVVLRAHNQP